MRTDLTPVQLHRPRKLSDALKIMREEECVPIAGCTDVFVELQFGLRTAPAYIDLSMLDELRGVRSRHGTLDIGATTTYADLQQSRDVLQKLPMLVAASRDLDKALKPSLLNPLSWFGGKTEVTAAGIVRAENGKGTIDLQSATLAGISIPKSVLQQVVSYYTRTPESPEGCVL